jgi:ribosome maturation factor RimP
LEIQACFDQWMTTILDSELKLVPNWNLNIVGLLEEVGSVTRFFFAVKLGWKRRRLAQQVIKQENELIGEVWNLLEPVIQAQGMEILEIEYRRESAGWVLRVYLDRDQGISVEDCAEVSRIAGDLLDVADLIQTPYNLEISSPGIDRPLRRVDHFQKHIGDIIEVRTRSSIQNRRNFKGELKAVSPEGVTIECDMRGYLIPTPLIERARLLYFESMGRK